MHTLFFWHPVLEDNHELFYLFLLNLRHPGQEGEIQVDDFNFVYSVHFCRVILYGCLFMFVSNTRQNGWTDRDQLM